MRYLLLLSLLAAISLIAPVSSALAAITFSGTSSHRLLRLEQFHGWLCRLHLGRSLRSTMAAKLLRPGAISATAQARRARSPLTVPASYEPIHLSVGYIGNGMLNITNGGAVSSYSSCCIGYSSGTSTASVDGTNSKWNIDGTFFVGYFGNGTLTSPTAAPSSVIISFGGHIGVNSGSAGTVTVDGAGSTWTNSSDLYVGNSGNGTLSITKGATVSTNGYGYVGDNSGSAGMVTVDGAGSKLTTNSSLRVGWEGNGVLNITGGAGVSSSIGTLGDYGGSTGVVTVSGAGSTWGITRI